MHDRRIVYPSPITRRRDGCDRDFACWCFRQLKSNVGSPPRTLARLLVIGDHVSTGTLLSPIPLCLPSMRQAHRQVYKVDINQSNRDTPGTWKDWRQLYIGSTHERLRPECWSSWQAIAKRLDEYFGKSYCHVTAGDTAEQRNDPRIRHLAGWADFHKTQVAVIYKGKGCFVIYPNLSQPAHHEARPGRRIVVQLGDDGARHWFDPGQVNDTIFTEEPNALPPLTSQRIYLLEACITTEQTR